MCGRYSLTDCKEKIIFVFGLNQSDIKLKSRYNICPSNNIPVIVKGNNSFVLELMEWGLIPFWSKVEKPLINARIETVSEKPSFRKALNKQRCIIPANGFFEWRHERSKKQPYFISLKSQKLFAFAGLWEEWISLEGFKRRTCAILTTKANSFMNQIHQRMPVILTQKNFSLWLNFADSALENLHSTCPSNKMQAWKVTKEVNSPTFDNPICLKKLVEDNTYKKFIQKKQLSLFN